MTSSYEKEYRGARFFKCDLQMGTPADPSHWRGRPIGATPEEHRRAAKEWVDRCYQVGLEVVAVTDHNFLSKDFLPLLKDEIAIQASIRPYRLVLFPGFEIEADTGKGVHALALFSPERPLDEIDHILTECGVTKPRIRNNVLVKSTSKLRDIINIVQRKNESGGYEGLIILAHPTGESGALNDNWVSAWLQADEFTNPELLALEIWKAPEKLSQNFQIMLGNGPKCAREWKRIRPIGWVRSSDAKALTPEENEENHVGKRHTWIRMSRPSIEALRQAFLDRESRITFGDDRPEDKTTHRYVRSLEIKNARFISDQTFHFSRHLTTLVGGRGSGKSAIVEFLRVALGQPVPTSEEAKLQHERLRGLLKSGPTPTRLHVRVQREGGQWGVESSGGGPPSVVEGDPVPNFPDFFPVRIFGQKELGNIANDRASLLALLDETIWSGLRDLDRKADDIAREIRRTNEMLAGTDDAEATRRQLETEIKDLRLRLDSVAARSTTLRDWRVVAQEDAFVGAIRDEARKIASTVREVLNNKMLLPSAQLPPESATWPNLAIAQSIATESEHAVVSFRAAISEASKTFESAMKHILIDRADIRLWRESVDKANRDASSIRAELMSKGIDAEQFETYERQRLEKQQRLSEVDAHVTKRTSLIASREEQTLQLREIWNQQTRLRRDAANSINQLIVSSENGKPFAEVLVEAHADLDGLVSRLETLSWNGRKVNADARQALVDALTRTAGETSETVGDILARWRAALLRREIPPGYPWPLGEKRTEGFLEVFTETAVQEMRLWRQNDRVGIRLRRKSGLEVGIVPEAGSIGQKATAVLAVLLAKGEEPLIVDQPEDDLDNAFLFHDLVPLLRQQKEQRQIVIVTHNANLPVNGDAELVIALDGSDGHGHPRLDGQTPCVGGLDRSEVIEAVSEILEGSEEAFRRRREKYGY